MLTEEQVRNYCEMKSQENALSKRVKALGDEIKKLLIESKQSDYSANEGLYTVCLVPKTTETVDEGKMLGILKTFWEKEHRDEVCPFIKTAEYVDMNELEAFMYKTDLPQDILLALDGCRIKKETTALTYKIKKEK